MHHFKVKLESEDEFTDVEAGLAITAAETYVRKLYANLSVSAKELIKKPFRVLVLQSIDINKAFQFDVRVEPSVNIIANSSVYPIVDLLNKEGSIYEN